MSYTREDVRLKLVNGTEYRLFIHDNDEIPMSQPLDLKTVDNHRALDKAKDIYFATTFGKRANEPEVDGKPASKLNRDQLNELNKQSLITICVKADISWTPQDTTEALVQKIIDHYNLEQAEQPMSAE